MMNFFLSYLASWAFVGLYCYVFVKKLLYGVWFKRRRHIVRLLIQFVGFSIMFWTFLTIMVKTAISAHLAGDPLYLEHAQLFVNAMGLMGGALATFCGEVNNW